MSNRTHLSGMTLDLERCMSTGEISGSAIRRVEPTLHRSIRFFENRSIGSLAEVQPDDASDFVRSRLESGLPASVAVIHNRRAALRLLFRVARRLRLAESDPMRQPRDPEDPVFLTG